MGENQKSQTIIIESLVRTLNTLDIIDEYVQENMLFLHQQQRLVYIVVWLPRRAIFQYVQTNINCTAV